MSEQTAYQDALTLITSLPPVERIRFVEQVLATLKHDLPQAEDADGQIEAFRQMPWREFVEQTAGILADDPIERPPQLPLEEREPFE